MRKFLKVVLLSVLIVSLLPITKRVIAQQGNNQNKESITLSPAVSRPTVDAGEKINGKLTIINDGKTDYQFLVYARPYSVKSETYDPNYTEINDRTESFQWVRFAQTDLRIKAGEQVEIPYEVSVPANATPGGHYAVLFAETQPPASQGSQVARKKRVGSLLYITVNGNYKLSGSVASWNAAFWQRSNPITAELRVKNDGNVHYQADSTVSFKNIFGKTKLQLNQQHIILPGTTRRLPVSWENAPYLGIYKISGSVKLLDKTTDLPQKWIVILPVPVLIVLGGLIAIAILYKLFKLKQKRSKVKRD